MPKKTLSTGDRIAVVAMSSSSSSSLPPVASAIAVVIRHGRRSSSRLACSSTAALWKWREDSTGIHTDSSGTENGGKIPY